MKRPKLRAFAPASAAAVLSAAMVAIPAAGDSDGPDAVERAPVPPPGDAPGFVLPAVHAAVDEQQVAQQHQRFDAAFEEFAGCVNHKVADVPGVDVGPHHVRIRDDAGDQAFERVDEACGLPTPPTPGGALLSHEQIDDERRRLNEFVDCMASQGQDLGRPEVGPDRAAIPLPPVGLSERFLSAQRECGGAPPPIPPGAAP